MRFDICTSSVEIISHQSQQTVEPKTHKSTIRDSIVHSKIVYVSAPKKSTFYQSPRTPAMSPLFPTLSLIQDGTNAVQSPFFMNSQQQINMQCRWSFEAFVLLCRHSKTIDLHPNNYIVQQFHRFISFGLFPATGELSWCSYVESKVQLECDVVKKLPQRSSQNCSVTPKNGWISWLVFPIEQFTNHLHSFQVSTVPKFGQPAWNSSNSSETKVWLWKLHDRCDI